MEIFKLVKELGNETLPMMTEFMYKLEGYLSDGNFDTDEQRFHYHIKSMNYRDLITQPFALGKYIPCDKDGKPMEEPHYFSVWLELGRPAMNGHHQECQDFQQAVDAVIFEGWRDVYNDEIMNEHGQKMLFRFGNVYREGEIIKTFEGFINSGGKLTPKIK